MDGRMCFGDATVTKETFMLVDNAHDRAAASLGTAIQGGIFAASYSDAVSRNNADRALQLELQRVQDAAVALLLDAKHSKHL